MVRFSVFLVGVIYRRSFCVHAYLFRPLSYVTMPRLKLWYPGIQFMCLSQIPSICLIVAPSHRCVLPVWGSGVTLPIPLPHMPNISRCIAVTTTSSLIPVSYRNQLSFVPVPISYILLEHFLKTAFSLRMPVSSNR